jgi:hypothetical protein
MPTCNKKSMRKPQSTLSYAFTKFNFKTSALIYFTFILCKASCTTPIVSVIYLPSKKPNCSFEIPTESEVLILAAIILVMILYTRLHKEIGLNPPNEFGLSLFGIGE